LATVVIPAAAKTVLNLRSIGQSLVHRDRPRCGRPDHRIGADQFRNRRIRDLERHIHLRRNDVLVFDLGLGQRGLLDRTPHHRLGAAIELAAFGKAQQLAHDGGLGLEVHREIRIVPIAVDAEALELFALGIDPLLRIGAAFGAEFPGRDLVLVELLLAVLLLDLPLDRQAVAVPPGHVWRVLAHQALGADHHVLEDVVERVADVDIAVGIGRAVVEDELLGASAGLAQLLVEAFVLPARQDAGFLLGKAGLHGKIGLREEDSVSVVALLGHDRRALAGRGDSCKPDRAPPNRTCWGGVSPQIVPPSRRTLAGT
jgi:hypothetical protein